MNQDNDKQQAADIDPHVSAHYASLADEKTPADLDNAVLREAARAVRADNRKGSFETWYRPVAFGATVGLSLAIILDLSDPGIFSPPADMSLETALPVQALPETTADRGTEPAQLPGRQSDLAAAVSQPQGAALENRTGVSDEFTAEVERVKQRVQEMEAAAGTTLKPAPNAAAKFTRPRPAIALKPRSLEAPFECSDEQKSDVEEWWKCIETLRQSGQAEAANLELENFREIFPDFELPE